MWCCDCTAVQRRSHCSRRRGQGAPGVRTEAYFVCLVLTLAVGCGSRVGGGGGYAQPGGAPGTTCLPASQTAGCAYQGGGAIRVTCGSDGAWSLLQLCAGGEFCTVTQSGGTECVAAARSTSDAGLSDASYPDTSGDAAVPDVLVSTDAGAVQCQDGKHFKCLTSSTIEACIDGSIKSFYCPDVCEPSLSVGCAFGTVKGHDVCMCDSCLADCTAACKKTYDGCVAGCVAAQQEAGGGASVNRSLCKSKCKPKLNNCEAGCASEC